MTKPDSEDHQYTHFGNARVLDTEKEKLVKGVFDSVANRYDLMNDLMSLGLHRIWKRIAVELCALRPKQIVLDVAAGSADLSAHFAKGVGPDGLVIVSDINAAMLQTGRDKLINQGLIKGVDFCLADAESLPFRSNYFDCISIGFGLRNVTHIDKALASFYRVLKPGGRLIILEFSKPTQPWFQKIYDAYSFSILPKLGQYIAKDEASYRYLAESIRKHPDQNTLKDLMSVAGFENCTYHNLNFGVIAIHKGFKY
jgi:demethylmenaquinone methyltransferase / 2-methoxy-6-polyprenyl-1,4-benzoquinol methylase